MWYDFARRPPASHSSPRPPSMKWISPLVVTAVLLGWNWQLPASNSGGDKPQMPEITKPVMFNTPEADKILAALQVFPPDNPWNEDISKLAVHSLSAKMIAGIG